MNESLSVLVVDDDISIQSVVEEILSDGGFEPKAASSGEEAIALLNAHRFRAVIIDIAFGKDHVKGWAVARRARAFNPALPIIYITGGSTDEWAIQGVPNSILITKPFPPAQLLTAVSQLLATGTPPSDRTLKSAFPLTGTLSPVLPNPAKMDPASYNAIAVQFRYARICPVISKKLFSYSGRFPQSFVCLQSMQVIDREAGSDRRSYAL